MRPLQEKDFEEKDLDFFDIERDLCGTGGISERDLCLPRSSDAGRPGEPPVFYVVVFDSRGQKKTASYGEVKVLSMNPAGASLAVSGVLKVGQELFLINPATGKQILCRVRSVDPKEDGQSQVGIDFPAAAKTSVLRHWFANARFLMALGAVVAAGIVLAVSLRQFVLPPSSARNARGLRGTGFPVGESGEARGRMVPDAAMSYPPGTRSPAVADGPGAVWPPEALRAVPDLALFRMARAQDFDPQGVSWLAQWHLPASGLIPGNYAGPRESQAYVLLGNDKSWRVVLVEDGQLLWDVRYETIAIAARLPREFVSSVPWEGPAPSRTDRDGLLVVRSAADPSSAVVLFLQANVVVSGSRPADYRQVPLTRIP
jgi:hypothetical protein